MIYLLWYSVGFMTPVVLVFLTAFIIDKVLSRSIDAYDRGHK